MSSLEGNKLMVSIRCLVYNHEPFLRECLDGFVMQKTNFRFEAIVHDDCSTDGSAAIIREYAEKYPDIIKPIFEKENQYSKQDGSLARIVDNACKGKYVALCEGDDYWIDPNKLQKQVDFLESHPDYSMCFSNAKIRNDENLVYYFKDGVIEDRDYDSNDVLFNWIVATATTLFRREALFVKQKHKGRYMYGDVVLWLKCLTIGKVRGFSDFTATYRLNTGGVTQDSKAFLYYRRRGPGHYITLKENFPSLDKNKINKLIILAYYSRLKVDKIFSLRWFKDLFCVLGYDPKILFVYFWKKLFK